MKRAWLVALSMAVLVVVPSTANAELFATPVTSIVGLASVSVLDDAHHPPTPTPPPTPVPTPVPTVTPTPAPKEGCTKDGPSRIFGLKAGFNRTNGSSAYRTAVAASQATFPAKSVRAAVLVNGARYTDALTAPALAGAVGGPVLFTAKRAVPKAVSAELKRLGVRRVYVIGGSGAVSEGVAKALGRAGFKVTRLSGPNRYATAAVVAAKVRQLTGAVPHAFVVSADVPWDALAVTPYAYSQRSPVLYVNGAGVPVETARAIRKLRIRRTTTVGGPSVIPRAVYRRVSAVSSLEDTRVFGDTRFETSHDLAHHAVTMGWASPAHSGIAVATDGFADSIVAGADSGRRNGVLLLMTDDAIPDPTRMFLRFHAPEVNHITLYGSNDKAQSLIARVLAGASE